MSKTVEKKRESAQANKESISELRKAKANLEVELQESISTIAGSSSTTKILLATILLPFQIGCLSSTT